MEQWINSPSQLTISSRQNSKGIHCQMKSSLHEKCLTSKNVYSVCKLTHLGIFNYQSDLYLKDKSS